MHNPIYFLLSILMLSVFSACKSGPDIHEQAEGMCICLKPLDSLNTALGATMASGNTEEITDALVGLSAASTEAKRCLGTNKLPGNIVEVSDPALQKKLSDQCPGWEELLKALPPE
ncbi:MAG: hypothetical protein KA479_09160 [Saprospiraceae bacterium]|nr:hypothetical protein [Saprospiraceae bacterium]